MQLVYLYNTPTRHQLLLSSTATSQSPLVDRGMDETTAGLAASFDKQLHSISEDNATTIIEYIATMKSEVNLSDHYRRDLIVVLCKFSKHNDNKPFKNLTRTDILDSQIASVRQKHRTLCTNGQVLTTFTECTYFDFTSGSTIPRVRDSIDNCDNVPNPGQDTDSDGIGDVCDDTPNPVENCNNGVDDDGDGLRDLDDPDCRPPGEVPI